MDFQRIRNRRRRVLLDEVPTDRVATGNGGDDANGDGSGFKKKRSYNARARKKYQLTITDLLPKRRLPTLGSTCLVLLPSLLISALFLLPLQSDTSSLLAIVQRDVSRQIAGWFCNLLFVATAMVCLQIFAMRRHRCDDYQASYRVWVWAAGLCFILSMICAVDLDTIGKQLSRDLAATLAIPRSPLLWLGLELAAITAISLRLLAEIRSCKISLALGLIAGSGYLASTLIHHDWFAGQFLGQLPSVFATSAMWATTFLLLAVIMFARHVYLDAHNLLQQRTAQSLFDRYANWRGNWQHKLAQRREHKQARQKEKQHRQAEAAAEKQENKRARAAAKQDAAESKVAAAARGKQTKGKQTKSSENGKQRQSPSASSANSPHRAKSGSSASGRSQQNSGQNNTAANQSRSQPTILNISAADRRLLEMDEQEVQSLSKSDRRRLKKLQKRHAA